MPCKTFMAYRGGKIALHALSNDELTQLRKQKEDMHRARIGEINKAIDALSWRDDDTEQKARADLLRQRIEDDADAISLVNSIKGLQQEAVRREPLRSQVEMVEAALDGTMDVYLGREQIAERAFRDAP